MADPKLLVTQAITFPDGTMQYWFRDFMASVDDAIDAGALTAAWGSITGTLSSQTDLQTELDGKIAATDVTYENLNTNGDIGTGATQVSQGDHTHAQLHDAITLAGTPDYITLSGQVITRNQVDLTADITGNLPVGNLNSGTGASATTYWRGDGTWATPTTAVWGSITGTLSDQTDLQSALDGKIAATDVTYENLNTNGDVGTGAAQVAQGDHTHTSSTISALDTADVTTGTWADARVAESNVTQHEAALTITWTQITGALFVPPVVEDNASASYTLVAADANKVKRFTAASPAVTIPTSTYSTNDLLTIRQAGTGTLVLTTTGLTINGTPGAWSQHVEQQFRCVGTDTFDVV